MQFKPQCWLTSLIFLIPIACQKNAGEQDKPSTQKIPPSPVAELRCLKADDPSCADQLRVHQQLSTIFSAYQKPDGSMTVCQDEDFGLVESCRKRELQFHKADVRAGSLGQRILIIDDGMELPALTRYHQQVLDILKIDRDGQIIPEYSEAATGLFIPALHAEALQHLGNEPHYITAKSLHLLAKDFRAYYRYSSSYTLNGPFSPFGHGSQILVKLADSIPDAQFVVLHHPRQGLDLPAELYCAMGGVDQESWSQNVQGFYDQTIDSIRRTIIEPYGISYINASFGHSYTKLKQSWGSICSTIPEPSDAAINRYFDLLAVYYQKLGSFENVLTVQAGLEVSEGSAMPPPLCRLPAPHRLIVDPAMREIDRTVAEQGDTVSSRNVDKSLSLCGDVFLHVDVASPYEMGIKAVDYDVFGFDRNYAYPATHSSYIAPVLLAHAVYLQKKNPHSLSQLIASIKAKPVRAPWRYAQIPACQRDKRICEKDALFLEKTTQDGK